MAFDHGARWTVKHVKIYDLTGADHDNYLYLPETALIQFTCLISNKNNQLLYCQKGFKPRI